MYGIYNQTGCLPNGDCILTESNRLIIYDAAGKIFHVINVPVKNEENIIRHLLVKNGLVYLTAVGSVYRLDENFHLTYVWQYGGTKEADKSCISFLVDQSNVMWFGSNAAGLCKIDLQFLFCDDNTRINQRFI